MGRRMGEQAVNERRGGVGGRGGGGAAKTRGCVCVCVCVEDSDGTCGDADEGVCARCARLRRRPRRMPRRTNNFIRTNHFKLTN